ncbi:hypothetical protein SKAU_G00028400 [Synaphobranchus kaupii]|uniref:Uncharacterized protein n=1 Tax=Synaphobranchus kaupii TaxID=118154 RepID=A0A9Q1JF95_SYNKA|nr:hypothetical protein SKAU_G00028400 [Synaphobranchus kaupii]
MAFFLVGWSKKGMDGGHVVESRLSVNPLLQRRQEPPTSLGDASAPSAAFRLTGASQLVHLLPWSSQ